MGQMGGRTALLTSLLVAMRDDDIYGCKIPAGDEKEAWMRHVWGRVVQFVPTHPGSHEAAGRWPSHDMPAIWPQASGPVLTPPRSPIPVEDSLEMSTEARLERPNKRRVLSVEVSSGSADTPNVARMDVPLTEDGATLKMEFRVGWEREQPSSASTASLPGAGSRNHLAVGGTALGTGMILPAAAPSLLGTFGLSDSDFEQLGIDWFDGVVTVEDVAREHGRHVAQHLLREWGEPGQCGSSPPPSEPPAGPTATDPHGEAVPEQPGMGDTMDTWRKRTMPRAYYACGGCQWFRLLHSGLRWSLEAGRTFSAWQDVSLPIFGGPVSLTR